MFAFRGLPAAWKESLIWCTEARSRDATSEERKKLHRIGDRPVIVTLTTADGEMIEFAARRENANDLLGPFAPDGRPSISLVST